MKLSHTQPECVLALLEGLADGLSPQAGAALDAASAAVVASLTGAQTGEQLRLARALVNRFSTQVYKEISSKFYESWSAALAKYDGKHAQVMAELQADLQTLEEALAYKNSEGSDPDVVAECVRASDVARERALASAQASKSEFARYSDTIIAECRARSSAHCAAVQEIMRALISG